MPSRWEDAHLSLFMPSERFKSLPWMLAAVRMAKTIREPRLPCRSGARIASWEAQT